MSKGFEIVDGVYVGPSVFKGFLDLRDTPITSLGDLREVGSYLDLRGTGVTSLGSLSKVRGSLYLEGTGVTSLGGLMEVGSSLWLNGPCVTDLGKLSKVGRYVFTIPENHYELSELEKLVKEIEGSSLNELVESLLVEEDPYLKRVIERKIRE